MYDVVLSEADEKLSTAVLLVSPKSYNYLKNSERKQNMLKMLNIIVTHVPVQFIYHNPDFGTCKHTCRFTRTSRRTRSNA